MIIAIISYPTRLRGIIRRTENFMAAVHFTTIPFEPNTANYTYSHIWGGGEIRPCNSNIAYRRFGVYKTVLCVFMSNFMVFMH